MYALIKEWHDKYAKSFAAVAFMLAYILERARDTFDKDLPADLQSRLSLEIKRYKDGRLTIIWLCRDEASMSGRPHFHRMWPDNEGNYSLFSLKNVAQPCELKLVCKLEKCFSVIRNATTMLNQLNHTAQELNNLTKKMTFSARDLYDNYKADIHDINIEKLLTVLEGGQVGSEDHSGI